jgi:hypothetical protein
MDSQYLIEGYIFISYGANVLQESAYKKKDVLGGDGALGRSFS